MFPRTPFACQNTQERWDRKLPINLFTHGRLGVKLLDASSGNFEGMDNADDLPFDVGCRGITIWIHVSSQRYWVADNDSPFVSSSRGMLPDQCGYVEKAGKLPRD